MTRKRTQLDRDLDTIGTLKPRIQEIWISARKGGHSHARILADLSQLVLGHAKYRDLPRWAKSELTGYFAALSDAAWRRDLVWRLGSDDRILTPAEGGEPIDPADRWGGRLSELARTGAICGAHFWAGTDHAFNTYRRLGGPEIASEGGTRHASEATTGE